MGILEELPHRLADFLEEVIEPGGDLLGQFPPIEFPCLGAAEEGVQSGPGGGVGRLVGGQIGVAVGGQDGFLGTVVVGGKPDQIAQDVLEVQIGLGSALQGKEELASQFQEDDVLLVQFRLADTEVGMPVGVWRHG